MNYIKNIILISLLSSSFFSFSASKGKEKRLPFRLLVRGDLKVYQKKQLAFMMKMYSRSKHNWIREFSSLEVLSTTSMYDWPGVYENINELDQITKLDFNMRGMEGPIPPEISELTALVDIDLGDNDFIGPVPKELARLKNLEALNLEGNKIKKEEVPEAIKKMEGLWLSL